MSRSYTKIACETRCDLKPRGGPQCYRASRIMRVWDMQHCGDFSSEEGSFVVPVIGVSYLLLLFKFHPQPLEMLCKVLRRWCGHCAGYSNLTMIPLFTGAICQHSMKSCFSILSNPTSTLYFEHTSSTPSQSKTPRMQYDQINNDHEFDSTNFSFDDHGIDLRLYDPSRLSSRGRRNSQYSLTDSLLPISTQPEPSQCPDNHSNPSTAQNTKSNLPIQSSQSVDSSTVDKSSDTVVWKVDWQ